LQTLFLLSRWINLPRRASSNKGFGSKDKLKLKTLLKTQVMVGQVDLASNLSPLALSTKTKKLCGLSHCLTKNRVQRNKGNENQVNVDKEPLILKYSGGTFLCPNSPFHFLAP
jgi:hypothetical protein